ncbi:MAG: acetylglutamate kinase [Spirochaetia bacterium]|nr:acetylglutamate kinase [Spirochaetia bacterium]
MERYIQKARILIEALPYIKHFQGSTFVVKYGGSAMTDGHFKEFFLQDVALLNYIGVNLVFVHGGGDSISGFLKKMGKQPTFVAGHRVTDPETLDIVEMVLVGKVNKEIVKDLNLYGVKAIGLSGQDGNLLLAKKKLHRGRDIGFVGEVVSVNTELLKNLDEKGYIPVIAPVGVDEKGNGYNINADTVAGAVACALKADKLIYLTDTDGVKINNEWAHSIRIKDIAKHVKSGQITGGMLPKTESAKKAIEAGVKKVHIINGTREHSMLLEIFTSEGIGTEIVK